MNGPLSHKDTTCMAQTRVDCAGGAEMIRLRMAVSNTDTARTEVPALNMKNSSSALLESYLCTPVCPARMATPAATCRGRCRKAIRAESKQSAHRGL